MKIITRSVIDIETGEVLEQESCDYTGEIAECKKGGGGGSSTEFVQSPEAREMLRKMMPSIERIGRAGATGGTLWSVPGAPKPEFDISAYGDVVSPESYSQYAPLGNWFQDIAPEIQTGMWAPYHEAYDQMQEAMGASGIGGSARGGMSGAAGAASGRFWEDAGKDVGLSGWQMMQPSINAAMQSQALGETGMMNALSQQDMMGQNAAMQQWGQHIAAMQAPYSIIPGMAGGAMPTPVMQQGGGGGKK